MADSEKREGVWTIREEGRRLVADGYSPPRNPETGEREIIPADAPNVLTAEEAREVVDAIDGKPFNRAVLLILAGRLSAFAEGKTDA